MDETSGTRKIEEGGTDRRSFLRVAGLAPVAAAGAAIATTGTAEAAGADVVAGTGDYRETDHVKTVYSLARF